MQNEEIRNMILFFDIGNTHTHVGLADGKRVVRWANIPTPGVVLAVRRGNWCNASSVAQKISGAALCSVVPRATPLTKKYVRGAWKIAALELTPDTLLGVGIDYPKPRLIGPDRLANAIAAQHHFGAPVVVVDFGTAVTFDVVNGKGNYAGGIIAPGLGGDDGLPA